MPLLTVLMGVFYSGCVPMEDDVGVPLHSLPSLPSTPHPYSQMGFPERWNQDPFLSLLDGIAGNPDITDEGATLGRVLFHDAQLSIDNSVSCGTCHRQSRAFSDDAPASVGVSGSPLHRNTPGLFNLQFHTRFFWDLRAPGLPNQVLQPIGHPDEMNMSLELLPAKLQALPYYGGLFADAFGDSTVHLTGITDALVQFLLSLRSYGGRYDQGLDSDFENLSEIEALGKSVFFRGDTRCNQCHSGLNFFSPGPTINGLEVDYEWAGDGGVGELTGLAEDDGKFKTVSLRNVGVTAPYMHDGRFATLREVVDFYSDSIQPHPFLDGRFSEDGVGPSGQAPYRLALTLEEREGLVAFMHTLTDSSFIVNPAFSSPF